MICPKCKKHIKHIIEENRGTKILEMFNNDGQIDWRDSDEDFVYDDDRPIFICPECSEEFDYDEAESIVLEEDELANIVAEKIEKGKKTIEEEATDEAKEQLKKELKNG